MEKDTVHPRGLHAEVDDALLLRQAAGHGLTRSRLRGSDWRQVSHGLYAPSTGDVTLAARFQRLRRVLPADAVAAHLTAARLHRMWLPDLPDWLPSIACMPPDGQRPERAGLYVFRSRAALPMPDVVAGIPTVTPATCIGQLAEDLSLIDLVVAIDSALHRRLCTLDDVYESLRSRQRGLPRLRLALELADERSESPWETVLRLIHVFAEIPVEPQHLIRLDSGEIVARADLRVCGTRRLPEYDGADHRDRAQHERDLARDKLLHRLGWERYGYIASEIVHHPGQVMRDAEDALGWRSDPRRLEAWRHESEGSSLSMSGRRRLLHRLHRFDRPLRGRGKRRTSPPALPQLRESG